ncbi:MAG TPA: FecR family protein, partial [Algoriphagus sp.]|nr:FecR family protein [Algoriphagus sp.]
MEETTLIKFFNGTASPKEEKEVREWLEKPESRKEFDLILEKHFENPVIHSVLDELDYTNLLAGIHKKITPNQAKPKRRILPLVYRSLRIAASIVLVLFLGYVMVQTIRTHGDPNNSQPVASITSTTRSTGPGEKLTLQMPDKTKIVINALSEISFSSDYGQKNRIIHLTGEAYFEVASDPNRPFKVVSDGITTTALGT